MSVKEELSIDKLKGKVLFEENSLWDQSFSSLPDAAIYSRNDDNTAT